MDTDKMHWAKRHNRHRVSVNWLYVSGMNLWQLYHLSRALSGNQPSALFGSCIMCHGPCQAISSKGFWPAVSSGKGPLVTGSCVRGHVSSIKALSGNKPQGLFGSYIMCQGPFSSCTMCQGLFSSCTICQRPCQATSPLVLMCWCLCAPCTLHMTVCVMRSLLCNVCLHCVNMYMLDIDLHLSCRLTMRLTHCTRLVYSGAQYSAFTLGYSVQHDTPSMYAIFPYE